MEKTYKLVFKMTMNTTLKPLKKEKKINIQRKNKP